MPETGFPFWPPGPWFDQGGGYSTGTDTTAVDTIDAPFIASVTQVFSPTLDAPAAVSQVAVEVLESGAGGSARISQTAVEVLRTYTGTSVNAGVSQIAVEVLGSAAFNLSAPFIPSTTVVYSPMSLFENFVNLGP